MNTSYTPKPKTVKRREAVLDVRLCEISGCPFFEKTQSASGEWVASCGASIYKATIPMLPLLQEIKKNPSPSAGSEADFNPFILRFLMSQRCTRSECGIFFLEYKEKTILPDPAEYHSQLFEEEKKQ